jgi:hypothetical protein
LELLRLFELLDAFGLLRELVACLLRELADLLFELFAEVFALPLELPDLLRELAGLLRDVLPLGLEPFGLRDDDFFLVEERALAWAINPSLGRCPAISQSHTPVGGAETPWVPAFSSGGSHVRP